MLSSELAFNEDGEPFLLPPQVRGWRARRVPRRGRPALVRDRGKPLIIRADATHADLLAAAGPGRYRLEAVDEHGRKVDGVPVACTGPLSDDEQDDEGASDDDEGEPMFSGPGVRRARMEDVLCQLLANQARMVEATLGQMGTVISGVAGLLQAAHPTGMVHHVPAQVAVSPLPAPLVASEPELDEAEDEGPTEELAPPSMLPEALRLIIEKTIDKLVPLIFEKVTSGGGLGGLPLAAILDWRKAMPGAHAAASSSPAAPAPPAAAAVQHAAPTAATAPHAAPAASSSAHATQSVTPPAPPAAPASAGAAPSPTGPTGPLGAAPATMAPPVASSATPQEMTQDEAAVMLNAHILQIWQGLTPPERTRAGELISGLTDAQRSAWFAELARLTVPEAIVRARTVLRAQPPPAPPTHPLPIATPKGDPSS